MATMCDCAKSDRCKRANKCPYEYNHLADYLCFNAKRYDKMTETKKQKKIKVSQIKRGKNSMTIADQVYIALTDNIDGEEISVLEIAGAAGVDPQTVRKYSKGTMPQALLKLESVLNAVGFGLEVVPIKKDDSRKDNNA